LPDKAFVLLQMSLVDFLFVVLYNAIHILFLKLVETDLFLVDFNISIIFLKLFC
jgi:hypothetical protein